LRARRTEGMVCESCQSKVKALVVRCVPVPPPLACPPHKTRRPLNPISPPLSSDKWQDGARSTSSTGASKGVMKTNKALVGKFKPETISVKLCRICKSKTQGVNNFCNDCAHKKGAPLFPLARANRKQYVTQLTTRPLPTGLCSICGKKVVDTSKHNMSLV